MQIDTPTGKLKIDDNELTFTPSDDHPEEKVSLTPVPEYHYERGLYGVGTLVIADSVIELRNDQAASVIEELRRPRTKAAHKAEAKQEAPAK